MGYVTLWFTGGFYRCGKIMAGRSSDDSESVQVGKTEFRSIRHIKWQLGLCDLEQPLICSSK